MHKVSTKYRMENDNTIDKLDELNELRSQNIKLQQRIADLEAQLKAQHESERLLALVRNTLQTIIDYMPHAIYWKDRQLTYRGCNKRFVSDLGFQSPQDIIGKTDFDLPWQPGEAGLFRAIDLRVIANKLAELDLDEMAVFPDGSQEWFETWKAPLCDEQGEVYGILGIYLNVTEQRKWKEAQGR